MFTYIANAEGNKALEIYGDGTSFYLSGIAAVSVYDLTIEGWIKLDGNVPLDDFTALVDFRNAAAGDSKALILRNSDGPTTSYEWNGNWTFANSENYIETDEWQHIAVVISGDDKEARFYINGYETSVDNTYSGLGDELPLGANIRVGAGLNINPERTIIGIIDEIRIWNVARTEDEILENMSKEIDPTTEGLLMYYNCNEDFESDILTDATGNGVDLNAIGKEYYFVDDTEWCTGEESSISSNKNTLVIKSYPNPVKDQLNFKGMNLQNAVIKIHDITGHLIEERTINSNSVNVTKLKTGMYFTEIKQGKNLYHGKFIKE